MKTSRREFLKTTLLGATGLMIGSEMVAHVITTDENDKRKGVKACEKPFFFIQYSDPQFGFMEENNPDIIPEKALVQQAVDIINRLKPPFVIGTGDYIHHKHNQQELALYHHYTSLINGRTRLFEVPGNHDIRDTTEEELQFYEDNFGPDHFYFEHENCAFVGMNSQWLTEEDNPFERRQYRWIEQQLRHARHCRFIFVFTHIPFFCEDIDEDENYGNIPKPHRQKYMKLFHKYGVNTVFCGHRHNQFEAKAQGVNMVTCGAVGQQLGGFHGMELIKVYPDSYSFEYIALDKFPAQVF